MKLRILGIALTLGVALNGNAQQDKHFSMFNESPMFLNPAAAGFFPGQLQLFTNFRMQWTTVSANPYRTISAAADWKMFDNGSNFMGAGIGFYNDVAGDSRYTTNIVTIPINYAIGLNRDHHLSLGLQPGFYQRTMSDANVTWDNQWTGTEFNSTYNSYEVLFNENLNINRFDISAGAYWYGYINKYTRLRAGIAGHHLTKQKVNYLAEDSKLWRKLTIHGQGEFDIRNFNLTVKPGIFGFIQGPNKELTLGSNFEYQLRQASRHTGFFDEISFEWGAYMRLGDALMTNLIFNLSGLSIGAGYDLNISDLQRASNGVGGFEFFLRYTLSDERRTLGNPSIR